jgi:hypothetical protein
MKCSLIGLGHRAIVLSKTSDAGLRSALGASAGLVLHLRVSGSAQGHREGCFVLPFLLWRQIPTGEANA